MSSENRAILIQKINLLEQNFPVETWEINGMHVWPLFKKHLFFSLNSGNSLHTTEKVKSGKLKIFTNKAASLLSALNYILKLKIGKCEIVFSGAASHKVYYQDQFINRYFKPVNQYLAEKNISFLNLNFDSSPQSKGDDFAIDKLIPLFRGDKVKIRDLKKLPGFEAFLTSVNEYFGMNQAQFLSGLIRNLNTVARWKKLYLYIFKKTKPKASFGLCYYSPAMFGMNLAANSMGITAIDMQHGAQGELHPAYHYSKVPTNGYNSLPKEFWCWDDHSYRFIAQWSNGTKHKAKVSGNPWLLYVKERAVVTDIPKEKPIILFTHQPLVPVINEYLVQSIKDTCEDFLWMIRLHPRITVEDRNSLIAILKEEGVLDKIDLKIANELALPLLLEHASIHISKFSGAIIEGVALNTPTIILEQIGIKTFSTIMEPGRVIGIDNPSKKVILDIIQQLMLNKPNKKSELKDFTHLVDEITS
ncbi:hypothetical protein [Lunatibacter salilacus]|uniref:hypothetical protein n=1 Tax=Lunatibacter salilacus TaxID=2483804 RepID=UPI00131CF80C|nr:hypothetical protein [Lunatibacter salilacus]